MIRIRDDYIRSLKDLGHVVYYKGKRVEDEKNRAYQIGTADIAPAEGARCRAHCNRQQNDDNKDFK